MPETKHVFRLIDPAWIISSGGSADPIGPHEPSGVVMRDSLIALGEPGGRIRIESLSRNTHEEAVLVSPVLHCLGVFRALGWDAVPAIAPDPDATLTVPGTVEPNESGVVLEHADPPRASGIPYYWARGWWK